MQIFEVTTESFMENVWIVSDDNTKHTLIIDPGDNLGKIIHILSENGLKPVFILNTHAHPDHLGAAAELQKRFELPFAIHKKENLTLKGVKIMAQFLGFNIIEIPKVTSYLSDGQYLEFGQLKVQVLHTPGHTPGSVCFLIGKHLFSGDLLFKNSIGRTDLPQGSMSAIRTSLRRIATLNPDTIVHPGHGEETTIAAEMQSNPFLQNNL